MKQLNYIKKCILLSIVVMQTIYSYAGPNDIIQFADENVKAICVENWDTNGDGELSEGEAAAVTELGRAFYSSNISSFDELLYFTGLKSINQNAFSHCGSLISINIPKNVTSIHRNAFGFCQTLPSITIPSNVMNIENDSFQACISLTTINVDKNNKNYDSRDDCNAIIHTATNTLITGCSKTVIPNSVEIIDELAFFRCENLKTINIPEGVKIIKSQAFSYCYGMESIIIPKSIEHIENNVFMGNNNMMSIVVADGNTVYDSRNNCNAIIETSKNRLVVACPRTIIPSDVTRIGSHAFDDVHISNLTIPNSVTDIEECALPNSAKIIKAMGAKPPTVDPWQEINPSNVTLYIPQKSKHLYETADFWKNFGKILSFDSDSDSDIIFRDLVVKSICIQHWDTNGDDQLSFEEAAAVTSLSGCFGFNKYITSFDELQYFTGLTTIDEQTFLECTSLASIIIPINVTIVDNYAFYGCSSLTSISIPNSVTTIKDSSFQNCSGLTSISIPNSVTTIADQAFYCSGLTSISIPNSVTTIKSAAFGGCSSLTSIKVEEGNAYYDSRNNCNAIIETKTNTLVVGCKTTIIPNDVLYIGTGAFSGQSGLTSIIIPNCVTTIANQAFSGCSNLTSITFPNSVTNINALAFDGCSNLKGVFVGKSTPISISEDTFPYRENAVLYVPASSKSAYENADVWRDFAEIVDGITVTANNYSTGYGDGIPPFEYIISPKISELEPEIICNATKESPVGKYDIIVSSGSFPEGLIKAVNGTLTINKAPLTATAKSYNRIVGEQNPNFEIVYEGFKNGETDSVLMQKPVVTCEATTNSPAGRYPIKLSGGSAQNYELTLVNGELKVTSQHSLVINSLGNGGVSYAGQLVRDFGKIALEEDENVKITFVPDAGYRLSIATLNGKSILPDVKDNTYIIPQVEDDITIVVGFTESEGSFTTNMINYKVLSRTDRTVIVERGWYSGFVTIPTNVTYENQQWRVVGLRDNAFYDCTELISVELPNTLQEIEMGISLFTGCDGLAAMIWKSRFALTNSMLGTADNPNLLFYTSSANYAPARISNVVVNGRAEKITLKDTRDGNFYCPESFTAASISYTHNYSMESAIKGVQGWETIALPFTVQKIEHNKQGVIVPFAKYNNDQNQHPFWLYGYGSNGFTRASVIEANTPYIICMPNNEEYDAEYRLSGDVTFSAENVSVASTETVNTKSRGNITFVPAFIGQDKSSKVFALNVNNNMYAATGSYTPGSKFISNLRDISPFEAYMTSSEANVREIIDLGFENSTGIDDIPMSRNILVTDSQLIYNLSGQLVNKTQKGINIIRMSDGTCRKVLIK